MIAFKYCLAEKQQLLHLLFLPCYCIIFLALVLALALASSPSPSPSPSPCASPTGRRCRRSVLSLVSRPRSFCLSGLGLQAIVVAGIEVKQLALIEFVVCVVVNAIGIVKAIETIKHTATASAATASTVAVTTVKQPIAHSSSRLNLGLFPDTPTSTSAAASPRTRAGAGASPCAGARASYGRLLLTSTQYRRRR